jgi:hypothetical protein
MNPLPSESHNNISLVVDHLDREAGVVSFSRYRNLLIVVWLDVATPAAAERFATVGRQLCKDTPKFSILHWLTPNRPIPEPDVRQRMVEIARDLRQNIACTSMVLNGVGFWASAIRAAVNGMRLMSPNRVDLRVDHSLAQAATWLPSVHTERTGTSLTAATLRDSVDAALKQSAAADPRPR